MIPKRVCLENFLSFGTPATAIAFTDDEPLWVLGGPNGVGKSAVFDAITYALYGCHRGGKEDHEQLVRHGANGFRVVFEFEFNGEDFRITRNRPLKGRPTQTVQCRSGGEWHTVALPPAAGRQDPVRQWSERTLGLDFEAFTASVLLRQGKADEIITATGARRLEVLKKIIGAQRYEDLSSRVHTRARSWKDLLEERRARREALTEVTDAEVRAAWEVLTSKEEERAGLQNALQEALQRVPLARQWVQLDEEVQTLSWQIQQADTRAAAAARIRADHGRLQQLEAVVPVLRQLANLGGKLVRARETLAEWKSEGRLLADAIRAKHLRVEIGRDKKFLDAAAAVKRLRDDLAAFAPNLDDQRDAARQRVGGATEAVTAAVTARAGHAGLLEKAKAQQEKFNTVGIGVPCSLCGQEVTAQHAKQERARLAAEIGQLEQKVKSSEAKQKEATKEKNAAEEDLDRLETLVRTRDTKAQQFVDKEKMLLDLGVTADPDELRGMLTEKTTEAERLETEAGELSRVDLPTVEKDLVEAEKKARAEEARIATLEGQQSALRDQLLPGWKDRADPLDAPAIDALDLERQRLTEAGVAEQVRRLEQDAARRGAWVERLTEVGRQMADIPAGSRMQENEAERLAEQARERADAADKDRDAAKKKADDLAAKADTFRELVNQIAEAERQARLHGRLDHLLGKGGLQRELVRAAEREIVWRANETLHNLSDGDLAVELDDGVDGEDEAFSLRIRPADGPAPIGVHYLSGSQKFRVAVSVALAIGRFAAGQARRLEGVIIDEGFGSLDRDGLRAAAEELNRLRQHLRRIVLVSHQEDFVADPRFPVVIKLSPGENGTVAEPPVRR